MGKSALLEDTRERATDTNVLESRGVESEAALPFAAVHQLVRPALSHLDKLPAPQAGALRRALGLEAGGGDERFLVSVAVLSLLAEAAERRPLLCLVDDAHWLDSASADALVFVARRLGAEAIVMLFAARDGEIRRFEASGLPELRLGGLDPEAAATLLARQAGVALPPDVRERLIEGTGGNPLALLELPSALSAAQLPGGQPLVEPLPVSARVERAFLARVRRLPDATQTLLLVAAADESGELATVLRAAGRLGVETEALDAAQEASLVRVLATRLELRHPLVRSAVYHGAALSQRQAAHRAIAGVLSGEEEADRRAWHRAAASVEPDPSVAEELERAAQRATRRSGFGAASVAFERAASLTLDEERRARQLTDAAESAWFGGQPERALALLERARLLTGEPIRRADIARWHGLIEMTCGVPADALELLAEAAAEVAPHDGQRALYLLSLASVAATYSGHGEASVAIAELADRLSLPDAPLARLLLQVLLGLGAHFEGNFARAAPRLRLALELVDQVDDVPGEQPTHLLFAGRAALFLGDDRAAYRLHHRAASRARSSGALGLLTQVVPRLAHAELWAGRWASAAASAREGLELARGIGQHELVAHLASVLALVAAARGDEDECRSLAAESLELASARRLAHVADFAQWALALLELGLGKAEEALRHAREIRCSPGVLWAGLDRIEAAIGAGDRETASAWLDSFEPWPESSAEPWALAVTRHCRALLATEEEEAERLFSAALDAHGAAARPFERARTGLAFGRFLRRARHRIEAREHLYAALAAFEALGAAHWAELARVELRASGQTARRRDPSTRDELTAQELQVAQLVAQGLTNRDVAAQLFLSPRTIDFHLRNVFRKLGVASRTELARLELDSGGHPPPPANPAISPVRA